MTTAVVDPQRVDWSKVGIWGPPAPPRPFGVRDVVYGFALFLAGNVALAVPAVWWMSQPDRTPEQIASLASHPVVLVSGLAVLWAVFAGVPWWATARHGARSLAVDFGWRMPSRADWVFALKLGLVMRVADIGIGAAAGALGLATGDNSNWLFGSGSVALTVFFVLGAAVVAPALEELFYRGFVMRSLARAERLQGRPRAQVWVPVAVTTALFGLPHATGLDAAGLYVVLLTASAGLVLALVAQRQGHLGRAIAVHIVFNSTGVLGAAVMGG